MHLAVRSGRNRVFAIFSTEDGICIFLDGSPRYTRSKTERQRLDCTFKMTVRKINFSRFLVLRIRILKIIKH